MDCLAMGEEMNGDWWALTRLKYNWLKDSRISHSQTYTKNWSFTESIVTLQDLKVGLAKRMLV